MNEDIFILFEEGGNGIASQYAFETELEAKIYIEDENIKADIVPFQLYNLEKGEPK
jgi:hypothetical protein